MRSATAAIMIGLPDENWMIVYRVLGDIVVFVHLLWIVFLIIGAYWGVRHKKVKFLHISGLAFAVILQAFDWYCPLTHLEIWLRSRHDPSLSYTGSFIVHYAEEIVYLDLPRSLITGLSIFLLIVNSWVYLRKRNSPSI